MTLGIDLGTTNSLGGYGDNLFTSLVSSSVDIKEKCQVPRESVGSDIVSSYKTDMSMGEDGKLAVTCSSIILKDIVDKVNKSTGCDINEVVISVPAYFDTTQREAVHEAAKVAGLKVNSLINEPTAAALCVCKDMKDLIVVYDLGGGTFDISIVDARSGNYSVVATTGTILGGDDLDNALVDLVIKEKKIPIRYRSALHKRVLKNKMRKAKEDLQYTESSVYVKLEEFGIDSVFELTVEQYKQLVHDIFYDTIVRTQHLISCNLPVSEVPKIIFVGGSTYCPFLRRMVLSNLQLEEIKSDTPADLIVAKGVALYAEMVDEGIAFSTIDDVTKRLCIEDNMGKTITILDSNTILPASGSIVCSNSDRSSELRVKLYQGDSIIASKNSYIGTLVYDYKREMEAESGIVNIEVDVNRDGVVKLKAYQLLLGPASTQEIELKNR
ncbi:MAG: Hsp70 family protein [Alphaproteobacteria bacterium]|nr:Hsp70 family protein [Alphaproteobacteria bacterium]